MHAQFWRPTMKQKHTLFYIVIISKIGVQENNVSLTFARSQNITVADQWEWKGMSPYCC